MIFACIKGTNLCGGWIYVSLLCCRISLVVGTASHVCTLIQLTVFLLLITLSSQAKLIFVLRSNFSCHFFFIRTGGTVHASSTVAVSWSRSCSLPKPMSIPVMHAATQRCCWLLDMVAELCIVTTGGSHDRPRKSSNITICKACRVFAGTSALSMVCCHRRRWCSYEQATMGMRWRSATVAWTRAVNMLARVRRPRASARWEATCQVTNPLGEKAPLCRERGCCSDKGCYRLHRHGMQSAL